MKRRIYHSQIESLADIATMSDQLKKAKEELNTIKKTKEPQLKDKTNDINNHQKWIANLSRDINEATQEIIDDMPKDKQTN